MLVPYVAPAHPDAAKVLFHFPGWSSKPWVTFHPSKPKPGLVGDPGLGDLG